jgi:hypothetical protein
MKPASLVVELQVHPVVDLIVLELDVVLEDGVPLLEHDLVPAGARLRRDQLLEVADGVVLVALDPDLLAQAVVHRDLDHVEGQRWLMVKVL